MEHDRWVTKGVRVSLMQVNATALQTLCLLATLSPQMIIQFGVFLWQKTVYMIVFKVSLSIFHYTNTSDIMQYITLQVFTLTK